MVRAWLAGRACGAAWAGDRIRLWGWPLVNVLTTIKCLPIALHLTVMPCCGAPSVRWGSTYAKLNVELLFC